MSTLFAMDSIAWLYRECQWKETEIEGNRIKVETPMSGVHYLHRKRVKLWQTRIARILKYCRTDSFRSSGNGIPWQGLRVSEDGVQLCLGHIDKLMALGLAADFITIEQHTVDGVDMPVPYAVIEDVRIRNRGFRYASGRQNFRLKTGWGREGKVKGEESKVKS